MEENTNAFIQSRPQELCLMCGGCCRVVTTKIPYKEMQTMASEGDEGAIDFLELFEPFKSIKAARNADEKIVDNIINALKENNAFEPENLTFYRCRHLLKNNLCGIYQNRKELCNRFPSSPWAVIPPGCGFEGWLAQKRNEIVQKVRKQKENLLMAENLLSKATTQKQQKEALKTIKNIKQSIDLYKKYGANDW